MNEDGFGLRVGQRVWDKKAQDSGKVTNISANGEVTYERDYSTPQLVWKVQEAHHLVDFKKELKRQQKIEDEYSKSLNKK